MVNNSMLTQRVPAAGIQKQGERPLTLVAPRGENTMPYQYDVFISYRRSGNWPSWAKRHFLPVFAHWLGAELGRNAVIFFDQEVETGVTWPLKLAGAIAKSRILVALLSKEYLGSEWCARELAHMAAREDACGFGTLNKPEGLIVPALIHDGENLPKTITKITAADFKECSDPFMTEDSPTKERLSRSIRGWVPDVASAIRRAPKFDPAWQQLSAASFYSAFLKTKARQLKPPRI